MPDLGHFEKVELREIWPNEASDFTPWLAEKENLMILAETLGMNLEIKGTEESVGPFSADIVCYDADEKSLVLIENQLEKTDHTHLGQLMTYAAGQDAADVGVVWIAKNFTDEHRAALDWLNRITESNFRFYGLEIELWRIKDSPPAPRFNVVAKPNDWSRTIRRIASGETSKRNALYLEYWTAFRDHLKESHNFPLRPQTPRPQNWYSFGIGQTGYNLNARIAGNTLMADLYIDKDPSGVCIDQLQKEQDEIEKTIGAPLKWAPLPGKTASRVILEKPKTDIENFDDRQNQFQWLEDMLRRFNKAFRGRVKKIDPAPDTDEGPEA